MIQDRTSSMGQLFTDESFCMCAAVAPPDAVPQDTSCLLLLLNKSPNGLCLHPAKALLPLLLHESNLLLLPSMLRQ